MTRAPALSDSDDADATRLEAALSQLIQLLARQAAREACGGAQSQEDGLPDAVHPTQKD